MTRPSTKALNAFSFLNSHTPEGLRAITSYPIPIYHRSGYYPTAPSILVLHRRNGSVRVDRFQIQNSQSIYLSISSHTLDMDILPSRTALSPTPYWTYERSRTLSSFSSSCSNEMRRRSRLGQKGARLVSLEVKWNDLFIQLSTSTRIIHSITQTRSANVPHGT